MADFPGVGTIWNTPQPRGSTSPLGGRGAAEEGEEMLEGGGRGEMLEEEGGGGRGGGIFLLWRRGRSLGREAVVRDEGGRVEGG